MKIGKPMNRDKTLGLLLAAACFAGEFWETTAQETRKAERLEIQYTLSSGTSSTLQVNSDVKVLQFRAIGIISLILPEGLTELEHLSVADNQLNSLTLPEGLSNLRSIELVKNHLTSLTLPEGLVKLETLALWGNPLTSLTLPEDLGKNVEGGFILGKWDEPYLTQLSVHYKMNEFSIRTASSLIFPPARELIRNRSPDSDGVFRIRSSPNPRILYDDGVELGSDGVYRINNSRHSLLIEVYGVPTRISMNRKDDGVEIVWDRGQLQSAPSIDGPWTDITFDDTRRLFLRSSSPAEFFRVKP